MKTAVYCGTRNLYSDMVTAAKSLAVNSSVDKIYFLTEDPVFPYELPNYVECIDVSKQKYFYIPGPNVTKKWTWMTLIRAALAKVLPDLDKILSLDVDIIVDQNIDELWDLPIDDYYLSASMEPHKTKPGIPYTNTGVALYNLKKIREDKIDDLLIQTLNSKRYDFAEQDCINDICQKHIHLMPCEYNSNEWTQVVNDPKIIHFAAIPTETWRTYPIVQKYRDIAWEAIRRPSIRYMIHTCPERKWYVNSFLIPSMIEQGIPKNDIFVWNDLNHKGNLFSCMDCFKWCGENPTENGTWHIQDDILLSRKFAKTTREYNDGVVCGCCIKDWGPDHTKIGEVPVKDLWYSFQCIRIPDKIAGECAKWFYDTAMNSSEYEYKSRILRNKHDDDFFQFFMFKNYPNAKIRNLKPCIVDHIDFMLGGSLINSDRSRKINRAVYWEDEDLVEELEIKLTNF